MGRGRSRSAIGVALYAAWLAAFQVEAQVVEPDAEAQVVEAEIEASAGEPAPEAQAQGGELEAETQTAVPEAAVDAQTSESGAAAEAPPAGDPTAETPATESEPAAEARTVASEPEIVRVAKGNSKVVKHPSTLQRVSIANPEIADAVPVSYNEVVVNGKTPGTTSLLLWGAGGSSAAYSVQVVADADYVEQELNRLLPGEDIQASSAGDAVVLYGTVDDVAVAKRAVTLATSLAAPSTVVDNIALADPPQILLRVRFAEVNRSAVRQLGVNAFRLLAGEDGGGYSPGGEIILNDDGTVTLADTINVFLFHFDEGITAMIRALRDEGAFRSLAEPNLLAFPGEEASFLAGGEFPYPVLQGQSNAVTIVFKEFGIRLKFTPEITSSGAIRMKVAPEVSQLDFSSGLQISGFLIPTLLVRRAETVVELQAGQTFAIAGLIDSTLSRNAAKIPWLGEIPILGALFRSTNHRDNRTELLVLVTPHLVHAQDEAPALPTGEPRDWRWDRHIRRGAPLEEPARP